MARSSKADILDKFRFQVTFFDFNVNLSGQELVLDSGPLVTDNVFRSGFSEVTLPQVNIKERLYRENIDNVTYKKAAGLVTYEPVTLQKGKVEGNRAFYDWQNRIANAAASISPITTIVSDANFIPPQDTDYRKDLFIAVVDRQGAVQKAFFLFNAFPVSYQAGDALSAQDESKLIESMTVTYENFVELNDSNLDALNDEMNRAARQQLVSGALGLALGQGL